jgi:hypothetical protein
VRHQNRDETDVIMTQTREESGVLRAPERPGGEAAGGAGRAVAPDLQDAVTVAILARELAAGSGQAEGGGSR